MKADQKHVEGKAEENKKNMKNCAQSENQIRPCRVVNVIIYNYDKLEYL